jgi:hypothetical protein
VAAEVGVEVGMDVGTLPTILIIWGIHEEKNNKYAATITLKFWLGYFIPV